MTLRHFEYGLWTLAVVTLLGIFCWGAVAITAKGASCTLVTTPRRASAWIDGQYVGTTPLTAETLSPGRHVLRIRKFEHVTLVREIELSTGVNERHFDLEKLPSGSLRIESTPSGAGVFVDGEFRGETPLTIGSLGIGARRVRLSRINYLDWSGIVGIEKDAVAHQKIVLKSRTEAGYLADIKADPKNTKAVTDLAHYYILQSRWKEAEDAFTDAFVATAKHPQAAGYSDRVYQEVEKVFRSMFKYSDQKRGREVLVNAFVRAIEVCPDYKLHYRIAVHFAVLMNRTAPVQKVVEAGILRFDGSTSWITMSLPRRITAPRSLSQLASTLEARIRGNPKDFVCRFQLAAIRRQRGRIDDVIRHYGELATLAKSARVKSNLLGRIGRLWEKKRNYAKAAEAYRKAVAAEPEKKDRASWQQKLALVLARLKRNAEALTAWERAVANQENKEVACEWRIEWAKLCLRQNLRPRARAILNDVLKLSKSDGTRSRARELLKKT